MSNNVLHLSKQYKGDIAWKEFVSSFCKDGSFKLDKNDELETVVAEKLGGSKERANAWFDKKIPALGGQTPNAVLRREDGMIILRVLVMRMP